MLCSKCKKNTAIIFFNNINKNEESIKGLCYDCAKKEGIDPLEVLSKQNNILGKDTTNTSDFQNQLENLINNLSKNIDLNNIDLNNINITDLNNI